MQHIRTLFQDRLTEEVIFSVEDVILPITKGERLNIDGKQYTAYQVTMHLNNLETGGKQIIETIWI